MNEDLLEKATVASVSRRTVVKTGAKLAYAAPLLAASFKLVGGGALAADLWLDIVDEADYYGEFGGDAAVCKVVICHANCSDDGGSSGGGYSAIRIPDDSCGTDTSAALAKHIAGHHKNNCGNNDFFPTEVDEAHNKANCNGLVINPLSA
jgi:hypothetical protein